MKKLNYFISRFFNIILIVLITGLALDEYNIINFSSILKEILFFLTFILILICATKEIILNKSILSKFVNFTILCCGIIGGITSIMVNQINYVIYIGTLMALIYGFVELVYKKI